MASVSSGPPNPRQSNRGPQRAYSWRGAPITVILIALCGLVAIASQLGYNTGPVSWMFYAEPSEGRLLDALEEQMDQLYDQGEEETAAYDSLIEAYEEALGKQSHPLADLKRGQVWRLITPAFLHFGPIHLIFNMLWIWTLGRMLEPLLRGPKYLLLVALIAAGSNTAEAFLGGTNFGGMSGVVYGLFGFVLILGKVYPMGAPQLNSSTVRYMLIWLVLCFTGLLGPIANWAHTFGLGIGGLLGGLWGLHVGGWKTIKRRQEFHRAVSSGGGAIHSCASCGRTEHDDQDLEFRVAADGSEYCLEHIPRTTNP